MAETLKEKTAKGLLWGAVNNGTMQVLNILFGIYLGRLLCPDDYGLVGMLAIFTAIAGNLQSSGFSQALVNLKNPTARDYNSVFWFNVSVSAFLYIVLFFSAPLIADYYHQEVLVDLSRFVFLAFFISSFGISHSAYMWKNMMNKEITIISILSLLLSGVVGVCLAYTGHAYWSLAWQQVVYITCFTFGRYYYTPWHPVLKIDFGPVRKMFPFSVKVLVTSILNSVSNNVLTAIFGRLYPLNDVGNFTQGYKWNFMAYSFVSGMVQQVAQPVLTSIRDDADRDKRVFRKMTRFTSFVSFPVMFGLVLVANEFILLTIKDKWIDCIPLLQILCVGGAFMPLYTMYQNLAVSHGRSDIYMWCSIAQLVAQIAVIIALHSLGIRIMVMAYTVVNIFWLVVWFVSTRRLISLRLWETLSDILPFALVSAMTMAVAWLASTFFENMYVVFMVKVVVAVVVYVAIMKLLRVEILNECLAFVKGRNKKD